MAQYDKVVRHEHYEFKEHGVKITLTRGQRGNYGWEISVSGQDINDVLARIKDADEKLRRTFLEG